jgi:hypothetical protein
VVKQGGHRPRGHDGRHHMHSPHDVKTPDARR